MIDPTADVRAWFSQYLVAREAWERRSHAAYQESLASGHGTDTLTEITDSYAALAEAYFDVSAKSKPDRLVFGDPPSVVANSTRLVSVTIPGRDVGIIVTTEKSNAPEGLATHRYDVRRVGEEWRLVDRRVELSPGRWVRRLR